MSYIQSNTFELQQMTFSESVSSLCCCWLPHYNVRVRKRISEIISGYRYKKVPEHNKTEMNILNHLMSTHMSNQSNDAEDYFHWFIIKEIFLLFTHFSRNMVNRINRNFKLGRTETEYRVWFWNMYNCTALALFSWYHFVRVIFPQWCVFFYTR